MFAPPSAPLASPPPLLAPPPLASPPPAPLGALLHATATPAAVAIAPAASPASSLCPSAAAPETASLPLSFPSCRLGAGAGVAGGPFAASCASGSSVPVAGNGFGTPCSSAGGAIGSRPPERSRREGSIGRTSESSAVIEDTEDDFPTNITHLEKFYEMFAAKARLPQQQGQNWALHLARSHRRLSREHRLRARMRELMRTPSRQTACPNLVSPPGYSSTDDSGYEAGYETDADESEFSERESAAPQRHKRKLDALVQLTMRLSVSEKRGDQEEDAQGNGGCEGHASCEGGLQLPPRKRCTFGTGPVGQWLSLTPAAPPPSLGMAGALAKSSPERAPAQIRCQLPPVAPLMLLWNQSVQDNTAATAASGAPAQLAGIVASHSTAAHAEAAESETCAVAMDVEE